MNCRLGSHAAKCSASRTPATTVQRSSYRVSDRISSRCRHQRPGERDAPSRAGCARTRWRAGRTELAAMSGADVAIAEHGDAEQDEVGRRRTPDRVGARGRAHPHIQPTCPISRRAVERRGRPGGIRRHRCGPATTPARRASRAPQPRRGRSVSGRRRRPCAVTSTGTPQSAKVSSSPGLPSAIWSRQRLAGGGDPELAAASTPAAMAGWPSIVVLVALGDGAVRLEEAGSSAGVEVAELGERGERRVAQPAP